MSHKGKEKTDAPRTIRVFIASPGDLAVERRAFKEVIEELNQGFGDGAGVKFEALGWEDTLAATGRRVQGVINQDIDHCDVFVLAMHRRWGQPAPDAAPYSSYTEEEFHRAYNRWKTVPNGGKERAPEVFVFFKSIEPAQMADAGPQLQKVLNFRKQLEDSREVLYRGFGDETEFRDEIDRHLRAFATGDLPQADADRYKVVLPIGALEEIQKERAEKEAALKLAQDEHNAAEVAVARAEALALGLAESAAQAALDGRVEEARQYLAKSADGTTNIRVLYLAYEFYSRTGDLATAEEILERWLAISGPDSETSDTAAAICNLGLIHQTRGDLDKAEDMHKKSLVIEEKLGDREGMASNYGNLGLIYQTRGDLDMAEEMQKKALAIDEELGSLEGMASDYGNLGAIYKTRDDLDMAEEMLKKSLAIEEKLGRKEGMASQYGNLGLIYKTRGDLDMAEEMLKKSLAIEEQLGRRRGMAVQFGNLGNIYRTRGDLDMAEKIYKKALAIDEQLGRREGMASQYGNLGLIYDARGDLDMAEEMQKKALAIFEKLGLQEGMASSYGNLGLIYESRADLKGAREFWITSRDLFAKIGIPHGVKKTQDWLDALPADK